MSQTQAGRTVPSERTVRLDVWLWSVRLFPSRSAATQACRAGRVRVGGVKAKAAAPVRPRDRVTFRTAGRDRDVLVLATLTTRVSATIAAQCLEDHSPPPPTRLGPVPQRERGAGRPTKRDRRRLEQLRGYERR